MNVIGGHFLDEDIACFDAPFFGISRNEAKVSKPQLVWSKTNMAGHGSPAKTPVRVGL